MALSLREQVRAQQYEFYVLSLFFPAAKRPAAWVILAFYAEIMAIADKISEPLAGAVRLAWWRDRVADIYSGRPVPQHPVLQALGEVIEQYALPIELWQRMLEAAARRIERESYLDLAAFERAGKELTHPLYSALALLEGATENERAALYPLSVVDGMRRVMEEHLRYGGVGDARQNMYIAALARMDELLADSHKKFSEKRIINTIIVYIELRRMKFAKEIRSNNYNAFSVARATSQGLLPLRLAWALLLTK